MCKYYKYVMYWSMSFHCSSIHCPYMLSCPVLTHPPLAPGLGPSIRLCKTTSHPSSLYFPSFFNASPANTIG